MAVCDIPNNQTGPLFRDSSNCRVLKLQQDLLSNSSLTSSDPNEGFEGVACDPLNRKLYVAQEKSPMLIWSVDFDTGLYSLLIDVQRLPSWTSLITDIADISYDEKSQSLYVLSQESKLILKSKMDGTLINGTLSLPMTNQPEGLSFIPETGELFVYAEPNEIARFTKKQTIPAPNPVPVKSPVQTSLSPSAAPSKTPVKAQLKSPLPPVLPPVKAPQKISESPSASPSKVPVKTPVKFPFQPAPLPVALPTIVPPPVSVPVFMPIPVPLSAPVKVPTAPIPTPVSPSLPTPIKIPVKVPTSLPTFSPVTVPEDCGLFGFNFFCPLIRCGIIDRWLGNCD